ncbi:hypothetical protein D9M69_731210 [compost metagenome]
MGCRGKAQACQALHAIQRVSGHANFFDQGIERSAKTLMSRRLLLVHQALRMATTLAPAHSASISSAQACIIPRRCSR